MSFLAFAPLLLGQAHERSTGTMAPSTMKHAQAPAAPKGISSSDWESIRAVFERSRHAARVTDCGAQARSFGQQWVARFDGRGFTITPDSGSWTWGLELSRFGWGADVESVIFPRAMNLRESTVEYKWSDRLIEWYQNDGRGLEHGYTIASRPEGSDGNLTIELTTRGNLAATVDVTGRNATFGQGVSVVSYSGLTVFDANGNTLDARIEAKQDGLRISVKDTNAVYPLTIDPVAQQAYLKASNTSPADFFGCSVAISGNTVVVGAYSEDSASTGVNGDQINNLSSASGAAYVFVRSGSTWSQQAYLKASNTGSGDNFGRQVAVSGDTIVVSAPDEDSNATGVNGDETNNSAGNSGAAYVFVRNGATWTQQAYLKASNAEATDGFGWSLAASGDTVVIGAYQEDSAATGVNGDGSNNGASSSGAAYVFVRSGTSWSQQAYLKASNAGANDVFGISIAMSGDIIVAGAPGEDSNATGVNGSGSNDSASNSGGAYVFVRNGAAWSQQAYLKASNTGINDEFGVSVAASGETVVVGANREDSIASGVNGDQASNGAASSGAAYVFVRSGATWSQQAYLKASNPEANDEFGLPVAISGNTIVVAALNEDSTATGVNGNQSDNGATSAGAAYVFVRNGASWSQQFYLKASNTESLDEFGQSLAISGDTIVVGTIDEDSNATGVNGNQSNNSHSGAGAAYTFDLDNNPGTAAYGTGTPGCSGTHTLDVTHAPMIHSPHFGFTCNNAPPSSLGLGILANAQDLAGSDPFFIGVLLHVDLFASTETVSLDFFSDASGNGLAAAPIPNAPALVGNTYYVMALWAWTTCSLPPYNLSTSQGLAMTVLVP